jgi:hypothetical protein
MKTCSWTNSRTAMSGFLSCRPRVTSLDDDKLSSLLDFILIEPTTADSQKRAMKYQPSNPKNAPHGEPAALPEHRPLLSVLHQEGCPDRK